MKNTSTSIDLIRALEKHEGFTILDREFYTSEQIYQQDLQQIWYRDWVFAGHSIELPKPGDFITLQIGDCPIVLVRDRDGDIRGFHNVCRHRGSKICIETKGKTRNFICPYHQWSYDLTGKLFNARSMSDDFNYDDHSLNPIHVEVVSTHIFICLAENPPSFDVFRQAAQRYFEPYSLADCKVAHETTEIENGNWKIVFENNRECYHCHKGHPELSKSFVDDLAGNSGCADTELTEFWDACEQGGLPSASVAAHDNQYRLMRVALAPDFHSYTPDGKPAVSKRLHNSNIENSGALLLYHFPSSWYHYLGDHILSFRALPLAHNKTELTTKWLVHKDAVEGEDYQLDHLTAVWEATNEQDMAFVELVQKGVSSPVFKPGKLSEIEESGVTIFLKWYRKTMLERARGGS